MVLGVGDLMAARGVGMERVVRAASVDLSVEWRLGQTLEDYTM